MIDDSTSTKRRRRNSAKRAWLEETTEIFAWPLHICNLKRVFRFGTSKSGTGWRLSGHTGGRFNPILAA